MRFIPSTEGPQVRDRVPTKLNAEPVSDEVQEVKRYAAEVRQLAQELLKLADLVEGEVAGR